MASDGRSRARRTDKARKMREYRSQKAQNELQDGNKSVTNELQTSLHCRTRDKSIENRTEEDIKIKEIAQRLLEMGYSDDFVDETLAILDRGLCPKTADMYRKIVNTMTNADIYNKDGYIYKMMQNEAKA